MEAADKKFLLQLVSWTMPFGKYKGQLLIALPEYYLAWFQQNGWPEGKLGNMLRMIYETRINGSDGDDIFWKLRNDCLSRGLIIDNTTTKP